MQDQFRHFHKTLGEIIEGEFSGKAALFCAATGIEKSIASKILNGRPPHHRHIQQIIPGLSRESALALFAAWTKDIIGDDDHDRLFGEGAVSPEVIHAASYHRRNEQAEAVLSHFRQRYMDDREFLAWLLQLGAMLEALPAKATSPEIKVADDGINNPPKPPEKPNTTYRKSTSKKKKP